MKSIVTENRIFFVSIAILAMVGGVYLFFYEKPDLIYFFSERRTVGLNIFFRYLTKLGEEPVYVLAGMFFLTRKLKFSLLIGMIGGIVSLLSFVLKAYFAIDRPATYFKKLNLLEKINFIEGLDVHSAATSFPSGHSMSAFALYSLLILFLPKKKRYVFPLLAIALGVAISRVYLVQHFYADVYVGSLIGFVLAVLVYYGSGFLRFREEHFLERPLFKVNFK